ncbi:hypothetical protein ACWGID_15000 [Kribbella sp. NPDC054772]
MTGILQGALSSGRALLVGWILPSLINVLIFGFVAAPALVGFGTTGTDAARAAIAGLVTTTVLGLVLAAVQTPLYRVLEGYLGWPKRLSQAGLRRQLTTKHLLRNRVDAAVLARQERAGQLTGDAPKLAAFRAHPVVGRYADEDVRRGSVWLGVLRERLHRYPLDDRQVAPTRLGNAIRRFEEYGHNRYRLDSQVLWHELNAAVPEAARKQTDDARMTVDFFICLLYGHLLVVVALVVTLAVGVAARPWVTGATVLGLLLLTTIWYRLAIEATDEWAGAVRAMVNLGRRPLAEALGLRIPYGIEEERAMWLLVSDLVTSDFYPGLSALDTYRAAPEGPTAPVDSPVAES